MVLIQLTGIVTAVYLPYPIIAVSLILFFFLVWRLLVDKSQLIERIWLDSSLLIVVLMLVMVVHTEHSTKTPQIRIENQHVLLQLLEKPVKKKNSRQAESRVINAENDSLIGQKFITYIAHSEEIENLRAGDMIFAKAYLNRIENQGTPYEFDYKAYLNRQGIFFSVYLPSQNIKTVSIENPSFFLRIERFREKLIGILKQHLDESAYQVASALTLGYRADLSKETQAHFISTGSIHVLSVSGMHVGMIFLILNAILGFLKRSRKGTIIYQISVISILWFYALLTGLCPPVSRATIMFTVFLIGEGLKRPASNYNSIATSAFILLFLNPNILFDVGFQLSYLSMISIFFFYPRFEKIFQPSNKIIRALWQLMCISFAAQIGVFPLSVYYFHQFPIFFWLSNFLVAPVAYFYIIFSAVILIFDSITPIASIFSVMLNYTNEFTLWTLEKIANLPGAVISVSVSQLQLVCLFAVIGGVIFYIEKKRKRYMFVTLSFVIIFLFTGLIEKTTLLNQKKLIVYQNETFLIHLINGRNNYLVCGSVETPPEYLYRNVLKRFQLKTPIIISINDEAEYYDLLIKKEVIQFLDKIIIAKNIPRNNLVINLNDIKGQTVFADN